MGGPLAPGRWWGALQSATMCAICGAKLKFLSPTRISHEIRGSTCLLTMLGASAVPRLGAKRSGADGASPQEAKPIDYVEITLSFLKRSFLLHNWR